MIKKLLQAFTYTQYVHAIEHERMSFNASNRLKKKQQLRPVLCGYWNFVQIQIQISEKSQFRSLEETKTIAQIKILWQTTIVGTKVGTLDFQYFMIILFYVFIH